MKTLAEIKNEVANSFGMEWDKVILDRSIFDGTVEIVAKRYALEVIQEAALVCKEHRDSGCFDGEGAEANILNIKLT